MYGANIPPPNNCPAYWPGHTVHWIQALWSANGRGKPSIYRRGEVHDIVGELIVVRFDDGDVARYRNHDTAGLRARIEASDPVVTVNEPWSLLSCIALFSIARDTGEPLRSCPPDRIAGTSPEARLEQLHTYGGF